MEKKGPRLIEIEANDVEAIQGFPFSGLKAIGGIHVGIGIVCIILGILNVVTYVIINENPTFDDDDRKEKQTLSKHFAIICSPVWCGFWFCMCGGMALSISRNNKASVYCCKISFLVLSILCACVFGPACLGLTGYEAYLRHSLYNEDYYWLIPLASAFLAFNEIVFAFVSTIVCCCCATLKKSKVRVFITASREKAMSDEQKNADSRPTNPHLQTDIPHSPPMFKSCSAYSTTKRLNFTANHLKRTNFNTMPDNR